MTKNATRSRTLAVLLVATLAAGAARADEAGDKQRATALLRAGAGLLDKKDFARALEKFTEAYALVPSAKIQFNIGLAEEGLGHPAAALRAYRLYLDKATTDTAQRRSEAEGRARAVRARVSFVNLRTEVAGATVTVDGVEVGTTPLAEPLVVDPGPHGLIVQRAAGAPWTRGIRAEAGGTIDLDVTFREEPRPVATQPVVAQPILSAPEKQPVPTLVASPTAETGGDGDTPVYRRAWFWGVVGGGVALAAGAALYFLLPAQVDRSCPTGDACIHAQ